MTTTRPAAAMQPVSVSNPDGPVRVDIPMPRELYDRLMDHDEGPRSRYDMATGLAEFVAEPGASHEWRTMQLAELFGMIRHELDALGHPAARDLLNTGATRLLSDDGAYEPDASLFVGPASRQAVLQKKTWLDSRVGHPLPALVAEVNRSVASREKLGPYFRMGVREAWTWSRRDGVRIWVPDAAAPGGCRAVEHSAALPGLDRERLDRLLAHASGEQAAALVDQLARDVAAAVAARGERWTAG